MFTSSIGLAHNLGIRVIAEGVDASSSSSVLRSVSTYFVQGNCCTAQ